MALPIEVVCIPAGRDGFALTNLLDGQPTFSTVAVGGFADCTLTLRGDQRKKVPYLALVRITLGASVLYEGQVEDVDPSGGPDDLKTVVTCIGLRSLLTENSVRRIWSKRDLAWQEIPGGIGATIPYNPAVSGGEIPKGDFSVQTGRFDPTDPTKVGVRVAGNANAVAFPAGNLAYVTIPGARITLLNLTTAKNTALSIVRRIWGWTNGSNAAFAMSTDSTTGGSVSLAPAACDSIGLGCYNNSGGALTPAASDSWDFYDIRILCTSVAEDVSGGFYGGSILRDLIALVPGLTPGLIEDGSDFTIQAIERAVRDTCQSVVDEVAGYYTREWAVWESGRFDWKTRQLDQPDWTLTVPDLASLSIQGTLDGLARTVYVLYTDAASGLDAEASAVATAQRNPYVKQGRAKDMLVRPGFPMTSNTSAQLASRLAGDIGQWVPVQGTITLPATKIVGRTLGNAAPAAMIRAGDNVAITDLPKSYLFQQGRDGETLFHIVGTTCDLAGGTVTLELEGQSNRSDVLLARLAAVTRTLTA